jgi:transcriptional regulator with XRE-family HTH domain
VSKWVKRFHSEGAAGLTDRSSRPHRCSRPTPAASLERIAELRRQRWTGKQIAQETGVSPATVSRVLKRLGLNKLSALEPALPVIRYERKAPGEMIRLDIKKLSRFERVGHRITGDRTGQSNSRGIGWEFVHVAIKPAPAQAGDASRIAFSQIMPDEKRHSATAFLKAALAYYSSLGITVARVMTDNGSWYRAFAFRDACRDLGFKHIRTKPYTPKTNGKSLTSRRRGPSASSRPPCARGATLRPTPLPSTAPPPCRSGCIATTGTGLMVAWMPNCPSAASAHPRTTC